MKEFKVTVVDDFGRTIMWQGGRSAVIITKIRQGILKKENIGN